MLFDIAAQPKNNVDDVDVWETASGWRTWRNRENVSDNAGVFLMSAKRGLSAVSDESGSAASAQTLARIPGSDDGGGDTSQKMKNRRRILSPSTCAVENHSAGKGVKFTDMQLKETCRMWSIPVSSAHDTITKTG